MMEMDSFFEFDASIPPDDGAVEGAGLTEDEEYDALNDETFGSAAVDGDWEESHEQMASLTEARRRGGIEPSHHHDQAQEDDNLLGELRNLGLSGYDGPDNNNSSGVGVSAPIGIVGYPSSHASLLGGGDLPGSPSGSIWTPSPGVDKLRPVTHSAPPPSSSSLGRSLGPLPGLGPPQQQQHQSAMTPAPMGLPTIKTVAELEEELKLQHARNQPASLHLNALRAEDLERELARQSVGKPQLGPGGGLGLSGGLGHQPGPQYNQQRPGPFNPSLPGPHQHLNRPFQRPPMNQGNYPGGPMQQQQQQFPHRQHLPQQQQQQRFMNSFPSGGNNKGNSPFNQHPLHQHQVNHYPNQPHQPHHPDNYPSFHHHPPHHHNNHYGNHPHQNYHHHNTNHRGMEGGGGGHYFNHNGYERRGYERRPYEQNKSQYERIGGGGGRDEHSGGRTRRDSEAEWEEWHRKREQDEYCGLMTPREKGWLKYIQAMQLHSDSPYQDDYYYVMYSVKQQRKREEEVIEIDGLQLLLPDRGKEGGREYEPPRLENSLGKLQVVSVNAPRKIIDLQVVHLDPSHPTTPLQREMRRHRHLLLYIEKLFNMMMELDDLERKIRHLPDCPTRDLFKSKSRMLATRLWNNVTGVPDRLVQLMCVRKGKHLLSRLAHWLGESEAVVLVGTLVTNMPLLAKKDTYDQHLALFWPLTDRLVATAPLPRLLDLASALTAPTTSQTATHKTSLTAALTNKYGVSLVLAMMVRGEQIHTSLVENKVWQDFLAAVVCALTSPTPTPDTGKGDRTADRLPADLPQALPFVALAASPFPPAHHLTRCQPQPDPSIVRMAQDRMALLEPHNVSKNRSQSPIKS